MGEWGEWEASVDEMEASVGECEGSRGRENSRSLRFLLGVEFGSNTPKMCRFMLSTPEMASFVRFT